MAQRMRIQLNISVGHNFHMQKEGEKWWNVLKYDENLNWRIKGQKNWKSYGKTIINAMCKISRAF